MRLRALAGLLVLVLARPAAAEVVFEWTTAPDLPAPRANGAVVAHGGRLVYVGGGDADTVATSTVWELDPEAGRWADLPPMREARRSHGAAVLEGRLYVFGGFGRDGAILDTVEAYDFTRRAWEPAGRMPVPRARFGLAMSGGKAFLVGGLVGETSLSRVDAFHPGTGWERRADLPVAAHRLEAAPLPWLHGDASRPESLMVVGGMNSTGQSLAGTLIYNPEADEWVAWPLVTRGRRNFALVRLGQALVAAGGWDEAGPSRIFPPQSDLLEGGDASALPDLLVPRDGLKGAAVGGSVYLCGGYDGKVLARVDRGRWRSTFSGWRIDRALGFHLATLGEAPDAGAPVPALMASGPRPDIDNIPLSGLLGLGFPVPADPVAARKTFYLKFYRYPPGLDPVLSATRVLAPVLALQTGLGPELRRFLEGSVVVKKGLVDRTGRAFDEAHPYPPLTEQSQDSLDRSVVFSSLYVQPSGSQAPKTLRGTPAEGTADGVMAFHAELLELYRRTFGPPRETENGLEFTDGVLFLRLPKSPLVFENYRDLPMPEDPQRVFLTGLLLVREDLVNPTGPRAPARVFEVGSVVRLPRPAGLREGDQGR